MDNILDSIQLHNIGKGLDATNPFSKITGKVNYNRGLERINQSLDLILSSIHGEVPMLPIIGCNLHYLIFEPADEVLQEMTDLYIREAISNLEPRIFVNNVTVVVDENEVYVTVEYRLTNTNISGVFEYSYTRENRGDQY